LLTGRKKNEAINLEKYTEKMINSFLG
jgi:hypothetical protein